MIKENKKYFVIVVFLIIVVIVIKSINFNFEKQSKIKEYYVASLNNEIETYDFEFKNVGTLPRGSKVTATSKEIVNEKEQVFYKVNFNDNIYLVEKLNLVNDAEEVVLEKTLYVRTPVTVLKDKNSSKILSMIKKGERVEVLGFDEVKKDGTVNKYYIKHGDTKGYVYGKYLVNEEKDAKLNYNHKETYEKHLKRTDTQGGGSASNLDYYPRIKPKFKDNEMPEEVRSLYLNSVVVRSVDEYIKIAKQANINAFVVDIKDNTSPAYASLVMEQYSPTNFKYAHNSFENYKKSIKKLKDEGFYLIGRITVFKDSYFVNDHPESAIVDKKTKKPFNHNGSFWPTAYNRLVWEFNVELAKEAVKEMGFNEIQFDYVRFPDRTYKLEQEGTIDMKNVFHEEKAQAIQAFLMYATDEIHQLGAYVSADVFGEAAHPYVTGYGQYWPAISNIVDVISAMPYPDHFNAYEYGFNEIVWTVPYKLLKFWGGNYVVNRQQETPSPAIVRTWIQAYDAIRAPRIEYGPTQISEQIKALYDVGLSGGFMTWNSASSLSKYKEIIPALNKKY